MSLLNFAALGLVASSAGGTEQVKRDPWQLAVLFRVAAGKREFVGTVMKPALSAFFDKLPVETLAHSRGASKRVASRVGPPATAEIEIWLSRGGETCGFASTEPPGRVRSLANGQEYGLSPQDSRALTTLIKAARIKPVAAPRRYDLQQSGSYPSPMPELKYQCWDSHVIAYGRIVGVVRENYSPMNALRSQNQRTVVALAVDEYLKVPMQNPPAILKIGNYGATLAWGNDKFGVYASDDPILEVGKRYIVFLKLPFWDSANTRSSFKKGYIEATVHGITGKSSELDEFMCQTNWNAKIRLENGRALAAADHGGPQHWRFSEGPQIIDVSEPEAIAAIREAVAKGSPFRE